MSVGQAVRLHHVQLRREGVEGRPPLGAVVPPATTPRARSRVRAAWARARARAAAVGGGAYQRASTRVTAARARPPQASRSRPKRRGEIRCDSAGSGAEAAAEGEAVHLRHVLRVDAGDRLDRSNRHRAQERGCSHRDRCTAPARAGTGSVRGADPPGFWIVPRVAVMQARWRQRRRSRYRISARFPASRRATPISSIGS